MFGNRERIQRGLKKLLQRGGFLQGVKHVNEIKKREAYSLACRRRFSIVKSASRYGDKGLVDFLLASESQVSRTLTPLLLL